MKRSVLCIVIACVAISLKAQDLPNPPANLQTLPAGSYVIPMDNTLQSDASIGMGKFNLKAYGLIVYLLNNNVKVKWVIRAGKAKDEADFTAMAEQLKPTLVSGAVLRSFLAAPFVIFANDTTGVSSFINAYYTSQSLTGNDRPKIFRTATSTTDVDIRYDMSGFTPKAAILTDGGNDKIHTDFMKAAGIPTTNYQAVASISLSDCFTFASEPHNDKTGAAVDSNITAVKRFVMSGRNFLAECAAITTYENNPLGRFQTTDGITSVNTNLSTNLTYPYADLAYYQFEGDYSASSGGSLKNWKVISTTSNPTAYSDVSGTGTNSTVEAASLSKMVTGPGGMVFYLGNHNFTTGSESGLNGIRMYLNAFMTPASPAAYCAPLNTLPVKLMSFQGNLNNNKVTLLWNVADNEIVNQFDVEKSTDGTNFFTTSLVFGSEKTGVENYQYDELASAQKLFYRLKMTDKSGVITYSKILAFQVSTTNDNGILIIGNPVNDKLTLSFQSAGNQVMTLNVIDMTGRQVMQQKINSYKGSNLASLPISAALNKGMYVVDLFDGATHQTTKFIKN